MPLSKLELVGECPSGVQVRFLLSAVKMTVGRHGDIVLREPSVSRDHAVLIWNGDVWQVMDAGSRNGTFVNGVSVQRKFIVPGDAIKFGRVTLSLIDPAKESNGDDAETCVPTTMISDPSSSLPHGLGAQALVGRSEPLKCAMQIAARAAKSNATVLLYGESGTGKELFAKLVWEESERSGKKFLPVHSGAIEPSLLASALFGHEKGAFTGADKLKKGLFEEADGGTIFLDEIGEINAETQVKLLRVLQEGEFMRVGGTEPIKVDVRVICATNRDLKKAVKEGKFREDLYYRLNVIQIQLPPLRERPGDIADLVNYYAMRLGGPFKSVSDDAMAVLVKYDWPGNVRELRNVVERMVVLSSGTVLDVEDLPDEIRGRGAERQSPISEHALSCTTLEDMESRLVRETLEKCGWNKKLAAERLGISRSTLYEKLKECPISGRGCSADGHRMAGIPPKST